MSDYLRTNEIEKKRPKVQRCTWSVDNLNKALEYISSGGTCRSASRIFGIPHSTLYDRIKNPKKHPRPGIFAVI